MLRRLVILCATAAWLSACGSDPAPVTPDGGGSGNDGGRTDAGTDAGVFDAGLPDAGPVDAGVPDAGPAQVPAAVGCVTSVTAGHHAFPCSGVTYEVEISPACAAGGCGVVLDVHGATMTADAQDKSTKLRSLAPPLGFVVVQPSAPALLGVPSWTPSTDDPKVWAFVGQLRQALVIDPKKIHMTGFSQGGAMTLRFLCAHADVLASVAPIAAADGQTLTLLTPPFVLDCPFTGTGAGRPSQQLPVLQMHGTADGLVPFAKGQQQRDAALTAWGLGSPTVVSTSAAHTHTRYTSASGGLYEFLQHDFLASAYVPAIYGHCIPGGDDVIANGSLGQSLFFSCAPPNAFAWGQVVMQFFVAHPRP